MFVRFLCKKQFFLSVCILYSVCSVHFVPSLHFVPGLQSAFGTDRLQNMPAGFLQVKLLEMFSQFGLVYEVQVIDSSDSLEGNLFFLFYFSDFSPLFYSQSFGNWRLEFINMKKNMIVRPETIELILFGINFVGDYMISTATCSA